MGGLPLPASQVHAARASHRAGPSLFTAVTTAVIACLTALLSLAAAGPAQAAMGADELAARLEALETVQANLNYVWVMAAAALVMLMQVGFLLLEAGLVRSKNSINVAQKNLVDFVLASCI